MISYFKKQDGHLVPIHTLEKGCWINVYGPFANEETKALSEQLAVDIDFFTDSFDIDERARYETEDGVDLIVLRTPMENNGISDSEALYITIPIGIIRTSDYIITVSAHKNPVMEHFIKHAPKNFDPLDVEGFILNIFEKNVAVFLECLKQINLKRYAIEKSLYTSSKNEDLTKLLNVQKSLIFFVTNLRSNELLMLKTQRSNFLRIKEEERLDLLQDIITENSQALGTSEMYSDILNGTMDAFASIISNNLNMVMKRLTSFTIILTVPALISGFYGMNVKLPFMDHPLAFFMVLFMCVLFSVLLAWYFFRKNWF